MDNYNITDIKNILVLKNQLLTIDVKELEEIYTDIDLYCLLLDTLIVMTEIDTSFLYFCNLDKIRKLININRFNVNSDIKKIINDLLEYLNHIDSLSVNHKNIIKSGYVAYNEDIRKKKFVNEEEFLNYISYDINVVYGLEIDTLEFIDDDKRFLGSVNYLIETIPEIFKDNNSYNLIQDKLKQVKDNNNIFNNNRKKVKNIQKKLSKLNIKEE